MKVLSRDQENQLILARPGDAWYEAATEVDVILDHQDYLEFMIASMDGKKKKNVRMVLEGFPKREEKTLRVRIRLDFPDDRTMAVTVEDQGFGEFFPPSGAVMRQEVML
jgi:hypothetical protein